MYRFAAFILCLLSFNSLSAQFRSMVDVPSLYVLSRDVANIPKQEGLALDFGYAVGTHYLMSKLTAGFEVTADLGHEKIAKTLYYNPFARFEVGVGKWRSNGQKCARTNQSAFTILAKGGLVYNFGNRTADLENEVPELASGLDYYVGAEFGRFFLKDMFKNSEFFLSGGYYLESKRVFAEIGIRTFLNTLAER